MAIWVALLAPERSVTAVWRLFSLAHLLVHIRPGAMQAQCARTGDVKVVVAAGCRRRCHAQLSPAPGMPRQAHNMVSPARRRRDERRRRGDLGGVEGSGTLAGCAVAPGTSGGAMPCSSHAGAMREIATPCGATRRRARNDSGEWPMHWTASDGFAPATTAGLAAQQEAPSPPSGCWGEKVRVRGLRARSLVAQVIEVT